MVNPTLVLKALLLPAILPILLIVECINAVRKEDI